VVVVVVVFHAKHVVDRPVLPPPDRVGWRQGRAPPTHLPRRDPASPLPLRRDDHDEMGNKPDLFPANMEGK
jgi:hypothetical protein